MKFLITLLAASLLIASSLYSMNSNAMNSPTKRKLVDLTNIDAQESKIQQLQLTVFTLHKKVEALSQMHTQFVNVVLPKIASLEKALEDARKQQTQTPQPAKNRKKNPEAQPAVIPIDQVPLDQTKARNLVEEPKVRAVARANSMPQLSAAPRVNTLVNILAEAQNARSKKDYIREVSLLSNLCNQTQDLAAQAQAWLNIGRCYFFGQGVVKNLGEAITLFKKAEQQNHNPWAKAEACIKLGECYFYGNGVAQNYEEAVTFFQKASSDQQNYNPVARAQAWLQLAECYYCGHGVATDYKQAFNLYLQCSAEQQMYDLWVNFTALFRLAECYFQGHGVEKNPEEAVKLLKKVAVNQYAPSAKNEALLCLARCHYEGYGIEKNHDLALKYVKSVLDSECGADVKERAQAVYTCLSANQLQAITAKPDLQSDDETDTE